MSTPHVYTTGRRPPCSPSTEGSTAQGTSGKPPHLEMRMENHSVPLQIGRANGFSWICFFVIFKFCLCKERLSWYPLKASREGGGDCE